MATKSQPNRTSRPNAKLQKPDTVVRQILNRLREAAFTGRHDQLLGSEEDLVREYGVSRPTFRQAAKLLEQEQLLKIKRGVNGGYFIQRPTSGAVAHMTAIYLQTRNATVQHLIASSTPLYALAAREAATNTKGAGKALAEFVRRERETADAPTPLADYLRSEREFAHILNELSGNAVASLFIEIILDLSGLQSENVWAKDPERIRESRKLRLQLGEMILSGDEEMAEIAARRWSGMLADWFSADQTGDAGPLIAQHDDPSEIGEQGLG